MKNKNYNKDGNIYRQDVPPVRGHVPDTAPADNIKIDWWSIIFDLALISKGILFIGKWLNNKPKNDK